MVCALSPFIACSNTLLPSMLWMQALIISGFAVSGKLQSYMHLHMSGIPSYLHY